VSIAPIVNFHRQIANFLKFMNPCSPAADFPAAIQGSSIRFKFFADSKGTDLGSFAKMIELPPQPCAPLAQLDRASDYESEGREFESLRARHSLFVFSVNDPCTKTCFRTFWLNP
jgi:hypothetical protein